MAFPMALARGSHLVHVFDEPVHIDSSEDDSDGELAVLDGFDSLVSARASAAAEFESRQRLAAVCLLTAWVSSGPPTSEASSVENTRARHLLPDVTPRGCSRPRWKTGVLHEVAIPSPAPGGASHAGRNRRVRAKVAVKKVRQPRARRNPKWGACLLCGRALRLLFGKDDIARPFLGCPAFKKSGSSSCTYTTRVPDHLHGQLPEKVLLRRRVFS